MFIDLFLFIHIYIIYTHKNGLLPPVRVCVPLFVGTLEVQVEANHDTSRCVIGNPRQRPRGAALNYSIPDYTQGIRST